MKLLVRKHVGIVVLLAAAMQVVYSQSLTSANKSEALVEEFSFVIKDFKMDHQTQTNNLNI